jgi:hypothetical protein
MTMEKSKALKKRTRVYWRGDAADSGTITETSWNAVTNWQRRTSHLVLKRVTPVLWRKRHKIFDGSALTLTRRAPPPSSTKGDTERAVSPLAEGLS